MPNCKGPSLLASDLYARSQGQANRGPLECHWCGAACDYGCPHDDSPPLIGVIAPYRARRPGNGYICVGCWLWRRRRTTVLFLRSRTSEHPSLAFRDGQAPAKHSWFVGEAGAFAVEAADRPHLAKLLLSPPRQFFLSLLDGPDYTNHLHLQVANDVDELRADTPLAFGYNNTLLSYTVFELEEALTAPDPEEGVAGKSPGVAVLARLLGPLRPSDDAEAPKRGRGRPNNAEDRMVKGRRVLQSVASGVC